MEQRFIAQTLTYLLSGDLSLERVQFKLSLLMDL